MHCVAWSPDGRWLASGSEDRTVRLWDPDTATERAGFRVPDDEDSAWRLAWGPGGAVLVSSHRNDTIRLWDTRFLAAHPADALAPAPTAPLPAALAGLPAALAGRHRLGCCPPLCLVRETCAPRWAAPPRTTAPDDAWRARLARPGVQRLVRRRWPPPARTGIMALLLHDPCCCTTGPAPPLGSRRPPPAPTP